MWATKTTGEAHEILAQPDVTVTNQSDKLAQLPKLLRLDALARHVFGRTGLLLLRSPQRARLRMSAQVFASGSADGATLSVASDGVCEILISLRFGEAMDEGFALQQSLRERTCVLSSATGTRRQPPRDHRYGARCVPPRHHPRFGNEQGDNDLFDTRSWPLSSPRNCACAQQVLKGPCRPSDPPSLRLTLRRFARSSF